LIVNRRNCYHRIKEKTNKKYLISSHVISISDVNRLPRNGSIGGCGAVCGTGEERWNGYLVKNDKKTAIQRMRNIDRFVKSAAFNAALSNLLEVAPSKLCCSSYEDIHAWALQRGPSSTQHFGWVGPMHLAH